MGRSRTFDERKVLASITNTFRKLGYEATSIKDLEKATGLTSGSLYNTFGGKDKLFSIAVGYYNNKIVRDRISIHLERAEDPVQGLKDFFHSLLNEPGGGEDGCLLTNTAVEFNNRLRHITQELDTGFSLLEAAFKRQVEKCASSGRIPKHTSPQKTAIRLQLLYQGILVFVRASLRKNEIELLINKEIDAILKDGN